MSQTGPRTEGRISHSHLAAAIRGCAARLDDEVTRQIGEPARLLGTDVGPLLEAMSAALESGHPPVVAAANDDEPPRIGRMLTAWADLRQLLHRALSHQLDRDLTAEEHAAVDAAFDQLMSAHIATTGDRQIDELRAMSEAQSKYMSFLSHDLRGSLNGVILMLEVLRRELAAKGDMLESAEDILLMRRSIMEAVAFMERHLQADRLRRGRVQMRLGKIPARNIAEQLASEFHDAAAEKHVQLSVDFPSDAIVHADQDLLHQALRSLIENAVKYSDPGQVHIAATRHDEDWVISVADAGPGMENNRLQELIDPVQRMQLRERGVGLLIAQFAARLQQGRIEGESRPGEGTTVRLILPAA